LREFDPHFEICYASGNGLDSSHEITRNTPNNTK
jgi:hypothetical protein